ncbi:MAG TPA: hypothetical protein PLO62_11790 [Candidatus Hydrogenedentes bacterium]|nr:hypothetical protein [Candidatus Hydrogenedentota bacterium]HOS01767.1 hypothetical protein [Candidatus Hydrogenedentota bacterium]
MRLRVANVTAPRGAVSRIRRRAAPWGLVALTAIAACGAAVAAPGAADVAVEGPLRLQANGVAMGIGAAGRVAAIENAERNAIAQALEEIAATRDLTSFGSMIQAPSRYVLSYNLLRHETSADATEVSVDLFLNKDLFCAEAAAILARTLPRRPRLVVLMGEKTGEAPVRVASPENWAADALCHSLRDRHMDVCGMRELAAHYSAEELTARLEAETPLAARLALENLADMALIASVYSAIDPGPTNAKACSVRLSARLLRGADAAVLFDRSVDAVVHSVNAEEGMRQATLDACLKLAPKAATMAILGLAGLRDAQVTLSIANIRSRENAAIVQDCIAAFPGVRRAEIIFYADALARLRIDGDFSLSALVDHLVLRAFPTFWLESKSAMDREVEMTLVSN